MTLVGQLEKSWHQIEEELGRWREILYVEWTRYKSREIPEG